MNNLLVFYVLIASESSVGRFWRPEVLGSTLSPGAGGGKKKRRGRSEENLKGAGALNKHEVGKVSRYARTANPCSSIIDAFKSPQGMSVIDLSSFITSF